MEPPDDVALAFNEISLSPEPPEELVLAFNTFVSTFKHLGGERSEDYLSTFL
jgi:hypothetical protein